MYKWIWPHTCADGENLKKFTDERAAIYSVGDEYPQKGIEIDEQHLKYMLGGNIYGNVYIEEVQEPKTRKKREPKDIEE